MSWLIGIDEVGGGAWAGPLVACAVLHHASWSPNPDRVKDSKAFGSGRFARDARLEAVNRFVTPEVRWFKVVFAAPHRIDEIGYGRTWRDLVKQLTQSAWEVEPGCPVVIDGLQTGRHGQNHVLVRAQPKADRTVPHVAAASMIAKVARDRCMTKFDAMFSGYDFASNMGYGTDRHKEGLQKLGPCEIHRRSIDVVSSYEKGSK